MSMRTLIFINTYHFTWFVLAYFSGRGSCTLANIRRSTVCDIPHEPFPHLRIHYVMPWIAPSYIDMSRSNHLMAEINAYKVYPKRGRRNINGNGGDDDGVIIILKTKCVPFLWWRHCCRRRRRRRQQYSDGEVASCDTLRCNGNCLFYVWRELPRLPPYYSCT